MRRTLLNLLLIVAFGLQGLAAVGADFAYDDGMQQHCAEHDVERENCDCCPDGVAMNAGCTAQCSVMQAPAVIFVPNAASSSSERTLFAQRAIQNPTYVPLIPPPIV